MSEERRYSVAEFVQHLIEKYDELDTYLRSLSEAERTQLTDATGWTVKDHIAHLAAWESSIEPLLDGKDRGEHLGVPADVWASHDFDAINEYIRKRHAALSLYEAHDFFRSVHERTLERLRAMSDEDLYKPYKSYQPTSDREEPVINWLYGNTAGHYAEHRPWIEAIVASG